MGSEGYDATLPHGHLPSLLLVCAVMIAMVMDYQYSNNDLYYVLDDPPYVECWHRPLLQSDVPLLEDDPPDRRCTVVLRCPGDEHFSDSTITTQQYTPTHVAIHIINTQWQWKILQSGRSEWRMSVQACWTRESGGMLPRRMRYSEITSNAIIKISSTRDL